LRAYLSAKASPDFRQRSYFVLRSSVASGQEDVEGNATIAEPFGADIDAHSSGASGHGDPVLNLAVWLDHVEARDEKPHHLLDGTVRRTWTMHSCISTMHSNIYMPVLPAPLPALSAPEHPSLPMSALQQTCANGQVQNRRGNERGKEERGKKRGEKEITLAVK